MRSSGGRSKKRKGCLGVGDGARLGNADDAGVVATLVATDSAFRPLRKGIVQDRYTTLDDK